MRQGVMLCTKFTNERLTKWGLPVILQPKLNGNRCRAVFDVQGHVKLLSSEGNEIVSVPHIVKQLDQLREWNVELDGELYRHLMPLQDLRSIVGRTTTLHPNYNDVNFVIFDKIEDLPQSMRFQAIYRLETVILALQLPNIRVIKSYGCETQTELDLTIGDILRNSFEGVIFRHPDHLYERKRSLWIMKYKPRESLTAQIVDYTQEVSVEGHLKHSLGAFVCMHKGITFKVGSGFTQDQRQVFWQDRHKLLGMKITVRFQEFTNRKAPLHPVFKELLGHQGGAVA